MENNYNIPMTLTIQVIKDKLFINGIEIIRMEQTDGDIIYVSNIVNGNTTIVNLGGSAGKGYTT